MKTAIQRAFLVAAAFVVCAAFVLALSSCRGNASDAALAREARERAPWTMPDEIFVNYVLPQTSVGEDADDWRPLFREKFLPLVESCKTPTEAAEKLNREIWDVLGVHYSPAREKPDQSPFHSMRIGKASCTGLSILLIDACRAVGVPARFVGCRWKNKRGNHSWVEIWDGGEWKHLGAGDGGNANEAWFNADAAQAVPGDPRFAIYAARAEPTGTRFPILWREDEDGAPVLSDVPALDVTERYLAFAEKTDGVPATRISVELRSAEGARLAAEIVLADAGTGEERARGVTRDDRFDLNDNLSFRLPPGEKFRVFFAEDFPRRPLAEITVPAEECIFVITPDEEQGNEQGNEEGG